MSIVTFDEWIALLAQCGTEREVHALLDPIPHDAEGIVVGLTREQSRDLAHAAMARLRELGADGNGEDRS